MFLPLGMSDMLAHDLSSVAPSSWCAAIYAGIFVSIVAFVLGYRGAARISASTAAVYTAVLPVTAVLLSYFVPGEVPTWPHAVGLICVLAAIALCTPTPVVERIEPAQLCDEQQLLLHRIIGIQGLPVISDEEHA